MTNQIFWGIGILAFISVLYQIIRFLIPYLRPSKLGKYKIHDAYVLVTGATDGIGKAITIELANYGFNIILCCTESSVIFHSTRKY